MARVFVLAQLVAHQVLDLFGEGLGLGPGAHDKSLDHLSTHGVGHADGGRFQHVGMHQDHVFDLDRAHGPAGRDDHVVGPTTVVEVALAVDAPQVLGRYPLATALHHELPRGPDRAQVAVGVVHLHPRAGHGLAQRTALDAEVRRARVADQHHADLGGAVHAADLQAEGLVHEVRGLVVDRLAGERQLLQRVGVAIRGTAVPHHAVVRGRCRHVGEAVFGQRMQQALGIEAAGVGTDGQTQGKGRERSVPEPMPPGRRRGAEEAVSRTQTRAVQRGHHQGHQRAVRVLDRVGQFARGARGVLKHREVIGPRLHLER
ncbi:hypothetical protein FQZ97_896130 [compost metagenome]